MSKTQQPSAVSPAEERDPSPPRGLSRPDQREFRRLCGLRRASGRPVLAIESDLICDYIDARGRLAELQRVQWKEESERHFFMRDRIALASAVDRAAASVRRLAKDLKLVGAS